MGEKDTQLETKSALRSDKRQMKRCSEIWRSSLPNGDFGVGKQQLTDFNTQSKPTEKAVDLGASEYLYIIYQNHSKHEHVESSANTESVASVRERCSDVTYATIRCVIFLNTYFKVWHFSTCAGIKSMLISWTLLVKKKRFHALCSSNSSYKVKCFPAWCSMHGLHHEIISLP